MTPLLKKLLHILLAVTFLCASQVEAVQFGVGSGSSYPSALDSTRVYTNVGGVTCDPTLDSTLVCSELVNDLQSASRNIETELGINPSGSYATVKDRLDAFVGGGDLLSGGPLGTPSSGTLTNTTGLPAAGVVGTALVNAAIGSTVQAFDADLTTWAGVTPGTGVGTALAVNIGTTGSFVVNGGALGTPSSGSAANLTSFPTLNQNTTGTAAALTANGANCAAGYYPLGVDASGAVESCTAVSAGDVVGPSVSVDNGLARYDGTTGKLLQGYTSNTPTCGDTGICAFFAPPDINGTAPSLTLTDTTASAKSLTITVDANLAQLRESAGASGSLMVLDLANNYVGIGTTGPLSKLDVMGTPGTIGTVRIGKNNVADSATAPTTVATANYLQIGGREYNASDATPSLRLIGFGYNSGFAGDISPTAIGYTETAGTDGTLGALIFLTRNSTSPTVVPSERLRITSAGNVGIGTTPTTLLDLLGADNTTVQTIKINVEQASVTAADTFIDFRSTTGSEGSIAGTAVAGVIAYNTFTGSHYTQVEDADRPSLQVGMLLEATGDAMTPLGKKTRTRTTPESRYIDPKDGKETITPAQDVEETFEASHKPYLVKSRIARTKGSKAAYGVYGGTDKEGRDLVLALGTGLCYVTKTTKAITVGDYLMASDVAGMMEAQTDDIYRNSTVAKAMTVPVWAVGETSQQIPCIYLGG